MNVCFLDELLKAIGSAVATANLALQNLSGEAQKSFYQPGEDGVMHPRSLSVHLPRRHVGQGEEAEGPHDIPESTLTHHHQIMLDTLSLDIDCLVEGLQKGADGADLVLLSVGGDIRNRSNAARLQLTFKTADPPEGVARINDQLLKRF